MGLMLDQLDDNLVGWIAAQPMFFVATAPSDGGRVNLSPKGLDTLRIIDHRTAAYLDLTGSGAETIAHVRQNGRITLMLCAFEGPPRILRMSGQGEIALKGEAAYDEGMLRFTDIPGARAIITVHIDRVQTSCGYAVPRMAMVEDRDTLITWAERRGEDGLAKYWSDKNATSVDGLPAFGA
jgi:hypothetical protein